MDPRLRELAQLGQCCQREHELVGRYNKVAEKLTAFLQYDLP